MWDVGRRELAQELLAWVGYGLQADICGQTAETSQSFLLGAGVDCTYICGQTEHIYQSLLMGVIDCTLIFVGEQYTTPSYQCKALPFI
jgi:hypothetical protein